MKPETQSRSNLCESLCLCGRMKASELVTFAEIFSDSHIIFCFFTTNDMNCTKTVNLQTAQLCLQILRPAQLGFNLFYAWQAGCKIVRQ